LCTPTDIGLVLMAMAVMFCIWANLLLTIGGCRVLSGMRPANTARISKNNGWVTARKKLIGQALACVWVMRRGRQRPRWNQAF
jgi:uncharacterized RDD family membrane protein YckC